jgi:polar amino acid transport system substrate-binding protein
MFTIVVSIAAHAQAASSAEDRQALAPSDTLRVGVYPGSPVSMVRDPKSGETKGISLDLGQALATSLTVAFESVEFARMIDVIEAPSSKGVWISW